MYFLIGKIRFFVIFGLLSPEGPAHPYLFGLSLNPEFGHETCVHCILYKILESFLTYDNIENSFYLGQATQNSQFWLSWS